MKHNEEEKMAAYIAKALALMCVRHTFLEELHSGIVPFTRMGDYSDVKVIDAQGREISWTEVSRFDDDEMKKLVKQIVNRLYTWFAKSDDMEFKENLDRWIALAQKWDDPELDQSFLKSINDMNAKNT